MVRGRRALKQERIDWAYAAVKAKGYVGLRSAPAPPPSLLRAPTTAESTTAERFGQPL